MSTRSAMRALPLSKNLPLNVGILHFVGIGGIGMSGIAEILHNLGYEVQGSDIAESANVERLRGLGIRVFIGHTEANVKNVAGVVISSAVKPNNPEVQAARAERIPVLRRAEMLAELMRLKMAVAIAGTHGKTTTTSLMATMFDGAGLSPTVINGGIINAYGTNARVGTGEWMVVEADESDGTFIKIPATIAVVTNIDPEHLDHYGDFDGIKAAFRQFVENIPFYGFAVLCLDHPEVQAMLPDIADRRMVTYGFSPQADVRAENLRAEKGGQRFDVVVAVRGDAPPRVLRDVFLPMHGRHNVSNSLAVITVALELAVAEEKIKHALAGFTGVKRRFTETGEWRGVKIIDDYGHHPVEIAATLKAAREAVQGGKVIAVVQPHRYTRVRDLFKEFCTCFNDADTVVVADIYAAGEEPIPGISRDALVDGIRAAGHRHVMAIESEAALPLLIANIARPGDYVVCLGAGSITKWAYGLPGQLSA